MINIRYHIVSITAVFLALGIGTALGSTFLDRYTVSLLDRNIRNAEERIRETKGENQRLTSELADARARDAALIQSGGQDIVSPRLADVPVIVVLENGVLVRMTTLGYGTRRSSIDRARSSTRLAVDRRRPLSPEA